MNGEYEHAQVLLPAIQEVVNQEEHDRGAVTKYVLIVEVMQPDGDKNLQIYRGPGEYSATSWDVKGMLHSMLFDPDLFGD